MEEVYILKRVYVNSESIITDCAYTKMIIIRPRCILASVTHKTFNMSYLQDVKVTVAVSDCGMCGENKAPRTTEKAPEPWKPKGLHQPADCWHSGRMDRVGPLCG